jgi:hypothetical protein
VPEFLVEAHVSRSAATTGTHHVEEVSLAAEQITREGRYVCLRWSISVPEDEPRFYLFHAQSGEAVREAARRGGLQFERVAEAVSDWKRKGRQSVKLLPGLSKISPISALKPRVLLSVAIASALAGVGAGVTVAAARSVPQVRHVSGTLEIALPAGGVKLTSAERPDEVSGGTMHAALFIDGAGSPAGQTSSCSATSGTGVGCTITWSASLSAPATHTFAVETDNGASGHTVLDVGRASYVVNIGSNALGSGGAGNAPLSLNVAAYTFGYSVGSCSGGTCSGSFSLFDAAFFSAVYQGSLTVPTNGQNPTSGNVLDNNGGGTDNVTLTSDNPTIGTVTGTASTFASFSSGTLTVLGLTSSGNWSYSVACTAGATGTFGIVFGGAKTPSGDVTAAELAGLSPAVSYPASGFGDTGRIFNCTSGVASDVSGSLVTN